MKTFDFVRIREQKRPTCHAFLQKSKRKKYNMVPIAEKPSFLRINWYTHISVHTACEERLINNKNYGFLNNFTESFLQNKKRHYFFNTRIFVNMLPFSLVLPKINIFLFTWNLHLYCNKKWNLSKADTISAKISDASRCPLCRYYLFNSLHQLIPKELSALDRVRLRVISIICHKLHIFCIFQIICKSIPS